MRPENLIPPGRLSANGDGRLTAKSPVTLAPDGDATLGGAGIYSLMLGVYPSIGCLSHCVSG